MLDFAARNRIELTNIEGYEEMLAEFGQRRQPSQQESEAADEIFKSAIAASKAVAAVWLG